MIQAREIAGDLPGGESTLRVQYVSGDGWDRGGGVGFTRPPLIGRASITKPYLEDTTVRAALKARAEPFSRLPLRLWTTDPDEDGAREITDHPLATIWRQPNALLAGEDFCKIIALGYPLSGGVYLFLADDRGRPVGEGEVPRQIIPVMRTGVRIEKRDDFGLPATYSYSFAGGREPIEFSASSVIPIIDHNPYDWTQGYGDVQVLDDDIDAAHQALRYIASFVRSGGDPGAWFKFKHNLNESEAARLQAEVDDEYGADGVSRYKVVSGEIEDIIPNAVRPRDLEYEKLLTRQRDVVLSVLGVPPPMVGILDDATYNNIRTAELLMWRGPNGILSFVRRVECALNSLLLPRMVGRRRDARSQRVESTWTFRFDLSEVEVLQADVADEIKLASEIAASGVGVSMNEALTMLGAEGVIPEDSDEDAGPSQAWVQTTLRPSMDRAGSGVATILADLAGRVASHQLPRESAIEIARATLSGTVELANVDAIFPDPGPKPEPPPMVVMPPGAEAPDAPDGESGEDEDEAPKAKAKPEGDKPEENAYRPSQAYAFQVGRPIEADKRLASIAEKWLERYGRETLALWNSIAAEANDDQAQLQREQSVDHASAADSIDPDEQYDIERSALSSYLLARDIWAEILKDEAGPRIEQLFLGAIHATHDAYGGAFMSATDPRVLDALRKQALDFALIANNLTEEIRDVLAAAMVDGGPLPVETLIKRKLPELTEELARVFGTKEARANAISRTETGRAQNTATLMQMQESGVTRIAWVHSGNPGEDRRIRHVEMSGEEVALGSKFSNGLRHPHDPEGEAAETVSCGCSIRAVAFEGEE